MSENNRGEKEADELTRVERLSDTFAGTTSAVVLETGLVLSPMEFTAKCYAVIQPDEEIVDVVDVDEFKSARQLSKYLRQFEDDEETDGVGMGVA